MEAQANKLAADILMPWHLLDAELSKGISDIESLAEIFLVSNSAMSIRLRVPFEYAIDDQSADGDSLRML